MMFDEATVQHENDLRQFWAIKGSHFVHGIQHRENTLLHPDDLGPS